MSNPNLERNTSQNKSKIINKTYKSLIGNSQQSGRTYLLPMREARRRYTEHRGLSLSHGVYQSCFSLPYLFSPHFCQTKDSKIACLPGEGRPPAGGERERRVGRGRMTDGRPVETSLVKTA
jgi:hypothetical protein